MYIVIYHYITQNMLLLYIRCGYFSVPTLICNGNNRFNPTGEIKSSRKSLYIIFPLLSLRRKNIHFFDEFKHRRCSLLKCRPLVPLKYFTQQYAVPFLLCSILHSQHMTHGFCVIKCVTLDTHTENIHILMESAVWMKKKRPICHPSLCQFTIIN